MFGENLKKYRNMRKLSQKNLADALNVSQQTVGSWEINRTSPSPEMITKISAVLNITTNLLLGFEQNQPKRKGVKIPVYGKVAAGIPIEAIEDIIDYEEIDEDMARNGEYIALQIKGDSMEPHILDGDVVVVRLQPDFNNGDTVVVTINGDSATCKKIKKTPEGVMLISINPKYEPMLYSPKQVEELPVRVLGKVAELRRKF